MLSRLPVFFFLLLSLPLYAQWDDTDLLPPSFHKGRRDALRALLPEKSVAVFFANPVRNRNNDVDFQYSQHPDFYYLTGCTEPDAVFVLLKEPRNIDGKMVNDLLFVRERDPKSELWTGKRLGAEGATARLGIEASYTTNNWKDFGLNWASFDQIFVRYPELPNDSRSSTTDLADLVKQFKGVMEQSRLEPKTSAIHGYMARLREVKLPEEIVLLQKAMDITIDGFKDMIARIQPGMKEYEAQAVIEYHAKKNGAEFMGYPSICGGGENACVLHYTHNRKPLKGEELLLVDMGAEYHGYTADITRTVPVDGKFSEEERAIYQVVLSAQEAGIAACRQGADFRASHRAAYDVIAKGLMDLGIVASTSDAGKYFMHGTSHYLGLDVHDAGTYGPLLPGVVMTVEPGIYIAEGSPCDRKWWNIGIRIEDDILVTTSDPVVMTKSLPRSVDELEKLMERPSSGN
jgi:Xaa-Pro aminopeptidase